MILPDLAHTLRQWRKAQGLTQTETADLLGVNPVSIVRWEQGATVPPYATHALVALAMASPRVLRTLTRWADKNKCTVQENTIDTFLAP